MVTLAVAGILLSIAVPSFQEFIASNRISTEANGFVTFLNLARSESIKSNRRVTLCVSTTGTSCSASGGWELGYIVFRDLNSNGAVDSDDTVLRVSGPLRFGITLRGSATDVAKAITYASSGQVTSFGSASRELVICDNRVKAFATDKNKARVILLRRLGGSKALKGDDPAVTVTSCTPT